LSIQLKWLQVACRPYIFLFIARPETILTSNGKAFTFTSPALKAVLKASSSDLEQELYTMTKKHAQLERLTIRDITALNVQVHHAEEEHARQLAEERARTAAALAESAQLRLTVNSRSQQ
jgi:phage FluMu protein gp41